MKNRFLLLLIVVCMVISGCSREVNSLDKMQKNSIVSADNIWSIQDNSIVYSDYEENLLVFYSYNTEEDKFIKFGEIENPYIYSGDFALVEKDIYFYCNELIVEENVEKLIHAMYKVDLGKQMLMKVLNDYSEQTLIYVESVNDKVFSLKGRLEGNQAITYLDFIDTSESTPWFHDFISKKYDNEKNTGEVIYNFSSYEGYLYILINNTTQDLYNWKIEKYDMDGNYVSGYVLDSETSRIGEEMISKFEVLGEYGFIRNFSGNGVLFKLTDSNTKLIFEERDLDISKYKNNSYVWDECVLYSRDLQKIWIFESNNGNIVPIDGLSTKFKCILMDDTNQMVVWGNDINYYNLEELISDNENLLVGQ